MVEKIQKSISQSVTARWIVLAMVSVTMLCAYFITDVIAPLETLIETPIADGGLGWSPLEYGFVTSAYGWFNVFLFMLLIGGIILDKMGVRFTGIMAVGLMILGAGVKYWAISTSIEGAIMLPFFGLMGKKIIYAGVGFAIFGVGAEIAGITVTKIIAKWFKGRDLAFAMALQVACARIGTGLALGSSAVIATKFESIGLPILFGILLLCIGFLSFIVFSVMDRRLDKEVEAMDVATEEEQFRFEDLGDIIFNKGFWYLAILCVLFYSAVFPFLKFATGLMVYKFNVPLEWAGNIPAILPFGTILLTPLFGRMLDRKGNSANIMILGAAMLVVIHATFALPFVDQWWIAILLMMALGIAFSLVPAAMWPAVTKIVPMQQLGSAYALIFWIQNWGLMAVPYIIGVVINNYTRIVNVATGEIYHDFTLPMLIFAGFGTLAIIFALLLRREDKVKGYGLQEPNIKK